MPREPRVYLEAMLQALDRIKTYTRGLDRRQFEENRGRSMRSYTNLEVLGEAERRVPEPMWALAPDVEWRKVAGMRDMIAHAYFDIDPEIVWDVVEAKLGVLEAAIRELAARVAEE